MAPQGGASRGGRLCGGRGCRAVRLDFLSARAYGHFLPRISRSSAIDKPKSRINSVYAIGECKVRILEVILSESFIQAALLLVLTALLTGLLAPLINANMAHRKFKQQRLFEADLARQNKIIEAQSQLLEEIEQLVWDYYVRAIAVGWYTCEDKDETKYQESFEKYDTSTWEFYTNMQRALSKARRLASPRMQQQLQDLYEVLRALDANLINLVKSRATEDVWNAFYTSLRSEHADEIKRVMNLLAEDLGLSRNKETIADSLNSIGHLGTTESAMSSPPTASSSFRPLFSPTREQPYAGGRRRALCVGINRYAFAPLTGCVTDARDWANTFIRFGFESPKLLLDDEATRSAILDNLSSLVSASSPGDVIAFHFSGYGTHLPGISGDEGDDAGWDEAIVPFDYVSGAYVLRNDITKIFDNIPDGVNMTCFLDCGRSVTVSRFAVGVTPKTEVRRRYFVPTEEMKEAHRAFRRQINEGHSSSPAGSPRPHEIVFSACGPQEVAFERSGHGAFTLHAIRVLQAGLGGITNEQFATKVTSAFGPMQKQNIRLDCVAAARAAPLLQPRIEKTTV